MTKPALGQDAGKPRILIVDDEEGVVTILRDAFEGDGWTVYTAGDGRQALDVMAIETFDVVMSDLHMPELNGLEFVSRVRAQKLNTQAKVCIISGHLDHENMKEITSLGITHVVVKPFAPRNVTRKIRESCLTTEATNPRLKFTFDSRIVRCVINAAQDVTSFYLQEKAEFRKPYIKTDHRSSGCMTALIELSRGHVRGSVAFSCDPGFLHHLAHSIFAGQNMNRKAGMIRDLAGEICNQISGKIKIHLAESGYHLKIGLPQVLIGKAHAIHHSVNGPVVHIPMSCKGCAFALEFVMSGDLKAAEGQSMEKGLSSGVLMFDD